MYLRISLLIMLSYSASISNGLCAAQPVFEKLVEHGKPLKLMGTAVLGIRQPSKDYFAVRSAKPGTMDKFGGYYISIALLSDVILKPEDFQMQLKMGLVKLSKQAGPINVNLKIGSQWVELAVANQQVTVKRILLDSVRTIEMEMTYVTDVKLDGQPFTMDITRTGGVVRIKLNGKLLQQFWSEPTGGDIAICVERESLLRVATSVNDTEAELHIYDWTVTGQFEQTTPARQRWHKLTGHHWRKVKRVGNAFAYVQDDPDKPNVLLIGDSISIYYTDTVRRLLAGHADVFRTPMGPGKAETLFASLDEYLAEGKWDVIHFNSGLHDFARTKGTAADLQKYRENLKVIISKLRKTKAKLIWANTTPVPEKATVTSDIRCQKYNATAKNLMQAEGIPINDLYSAIHPDHFKYWSRPNNIHFNSAGSAFLGRLVANVILPELPTP